MLTSCNELEDVLGQTSNPVPTPEEVITKYEFKVTDLKAVPTNLTGDVTLLKMAKTDGSAVATVTADAEGKLTIEAEKLEGVTADDYWFEAKTAGDKVYIAKASVDPAALDPETPITLAMATIGDVILSNGTFAVKGTTDEQAVIAYVGKVDKYFDHFLALALTNVDDDKHSWADALTAVNTYAGNHSITIGGTEYKTSTTPSSYYDLVANNTGTSSATRSTTTLTLEQGWRLPSVTDWRYIFEGLGRIKGGLALSDGTNAVTPTSPLGVSYGMVYRDGDNGSTLRDAINNSCGNTALQSNFNFYWSSSEYTDGSGNAWYYDFNFGEFWWVNKTFNYYVRAVFAY